MTRHKGDAYDLTQRHITHDHGGTIGQNVAASDNITDINDRPLVDAGVLVGAGVLDQVIDVDTGLASGNFIIIHLNHDLASVDTVHDAPVLCDHAHAGDRKSTRLNSSHVAISYAVFLLTKT